MTESVSTRSSRSCSLCLSAGDSSDDLSVESGSGTSVQFFASNGTDVSGDEAGADSGDAASELGENESQGEVRSLASSALSTDEMTLQNLISGVATSFSGGVVDLNAIGDGVRRVLREEKARIERGKRVDAERDRARKKRQKRREEWVHKPHQMITRSKIPNLLEKTGLTYEERRVLNERYGKNRCRSCLELKDLECFYRYLSPNPMRNKYHNLCIVCENKSYNERSDDVAIVNMWNYCKRRARDKGHDFDITVEDVKMMFERQNGRCNYTGRPLVIKSKRNNTRRFESKDLARAGVRAYHNINKASVDRIDPSRGYVKDNVHLVCVHINYAKLDLSEEDFISLCRDVVHVAQTRKGGAPPPLTSSHTESVLPKTARLQGKECPASRSLEESNNT